MKQINEEQLVQALLKPDTRCKAFEQLVNAYSRQLYDLIRRIVLFHDDADDVLQEVFLKVWLNLDKFRAESKLSSWLYRIAYNEALQFVQRQKSTVSLQDSESNMVQTLLSDPYFDGDETEAQLQDAVHSLPEKQQMVFNMKYFQEMKYEDIATITSTTVGALKASYHIAVKKIEEYFNNID